jgi:hypothetical protein
MRLPLPVALLALLALPPLAARADTPLPPPAPTVSASRSGSFRAVSDPATRSTRVERVATGKVLWRFPGWFRWIFVANDGRSAVTYYGNLIPQDYDDGTVLFTFWREGKKVREVTVKDLVPDRAVLQRTASHYHWGTVDEIDVKGRLVVRRADGEVFRFDLERGQPAE